MSLRDLTLLTLTLTALVVMTQSVEALVVNDCSKGVQTSGALEKVTVANCDMDKESVCKFVRGTNASIEVDFKTTRPFESAIVDIYGKIGIIPMPFPLRPNNACGNYGVNCPAKVGDEQKVAITLPILNAYPSISVKCQLKLHDEANNPIICIEFPIKITS